MRFKENWKILPFNRRLWRTYKTWYWKKLKLSLKFFVCDRSLYICPIINTTSQRDRSFPFCQWITRILTIASKYRTINKSTRSSMSLSMKSIRNTGRFKSMWINCFLKPFLQDKSQKMFLFNENKNPQKNKILTFLWKVCSIL